MPTRKSICKRCDAERSSVGRHVPAIRHKCHRPEHRPSDDLQNHRCRRDPNHQQRSSLIALMLFAEKYVLVLPSFQGFCVHCISLLSLPSFPDTQNTTTLSIFAFGADILVAARRGLRQGHHHTICQSVPTLPYPLSRQSSSSSHIQPPQAHSFSALPASVHLRLQARQEFGA